MPSQIDFIGFDNYRRMFNNEPLFWISLGNTLFYVAISVPLIRVGAVGIALLMNQKILGIRFLERCITFLRFFPE